MSPMAGGEGSLTRGTAKKKAAAKDPASSRTPRARATRRKGEEEAAAAAGEQKNRLSKGEIRWILARKPTTPPARISDLKRSNPELTPRPGEEADEDRRRLYRLAKAFYEMEERLPKVQEWVRGELEKKGYVEIDDEIARRRAEVQAVVDREWPEIEAKMKALILDEKEYQGGDGGDDSDSDDGGDEDSDEGADEEEDEVN